MREWAKLLLSTNPTLDTNMDMSPFPCQVTLKNNPPPDYSTLQIQPSSIQMPQRTTTFQIIHILRNIMDMLLNLNILLYTRIILLCKPLNTKDLYTKFPGIMHLSYQFQSLHIKCLRTKGLLCHIDNQHILATMPKSSLDCISAKTSSRLRRDLKKLILLWLSL